MSSFFKSFVYALKGLRLSLGQRSIRLHVASTLAVICLGCLMQLERWEWCVIIICIGVVISAEVMNTAIEQFVDMVSPEFNEKAGRVKDLSAGAVLVAAIMAAIAGAVIFGKHLLDLLS